MAERSSQDEIPPLKEEETLDFPKVDQVKIVHVFDPNAYGRGYFGVDEQGNIQSFLHQWIRYKLPDGQVRTVRILTHQGGPRGFSDIERPMRQYGRIIKRYLGAYEDIGEEEPGEEKLGPPLGLREFADELQQTAQFVEIPGHRQWVWEVRSLIDNATLNLITPINPLTLNFRLEPLRELNKKLDASKNPYLRSIGNDLEHIFESDDRFQRLALLSRAGGTVLERMREIDRITIALMERYRKLEVHRDSCEENVLRLAREVFGDLRRFGEVQTPEQQRLVANLSATASLTINDFIANPFKERISRVSRLHGLKDILEIEGGDRVKEVLRTASLELSTWREEIRAARKGRFPDRYPVNL